MTAVISVIVLAFAWESHFSSYALENMQRVANYTASSLEQSYVDEGGWSENAQNIPSSTTDRSIRVIAFDNDGNIVYANLFGLKSPPEDTGNTVSADIVVDDRKVGEVFAWAYGSSGLLSQRDREFRDNSFGAVLFASMVAVLISLIIGLFVSRSFIAPIRRITETADEIKRGNLSARTRLEGFDEISQLGMTIDDMAASIESDRELERRLTNDVAHELRTPLMAMQATMEAMVDGVLPADEQRLAMLNSEVIRLGKLVDALLKLSRLENRSTQMKAVEVDLGDVIGELVLAHQMLVEDSGLEFQYTSVPGVIVMADPDLIKQATANIISNAVRYTPEGGRVSIDVNANETMGFISVSDTGIGLSPDDLTHIFSRFWRSDAGRDRSSGGLGIGLAIVKEIVDRHDGWVTVDSVEGKGSTFTIFIPLVQDESKKQARKRQDKQGARKWFFPVGGDKEAEEGGQHKKDQAQRERSKREKAKKERPPKPQRERPKREIPIKWGGKRSDAEKGSGGNESNGWTGRFGIVRSSDGSDKAKHGEKDEK